LRAVRQDRGAEREPGDRGGEGGVRAEQAGEPVGQGGGEWCLLHTQQNEACFCCARNKNLRMGNKNLGDTQLRAWKALLNTHAATVTAIEARLAAAGQIPLSWYDVLWALRKEGDECGCLRFRQLQEEIVLSRSALSRLIDALAKKKLVTKKPCPEDARGLDVELTETGRKALAAAWPVYSEGIVEHFSRHLTTVECETLAALLEKVEQGGAE
jgi:DNA-binding MarR family transcriptional regulator